MADENFVKDFDIKDLYSNINSDAFELANFVKKEEIPIFVSDIIKNGDTVLVLGAGDIRDISAPTVDAIKKKLNLC